MTDLAHMETGTEVNSTSSLDIDHQPDNIIDGDQSTFWTSTGLFPQEFVLKLGSGASINKIKTSTTNVRHFVVESCDGPSPVAWVPVFDLEVSNTGTGQLQVRACVHACMHGTGRSCFCWWWWCCCCGGGLSWRLLLRV